MALLAGCGFAKPWPANETPPPGHHEVLLVGDSILFQTAMRLPSVYAFEGADVTVRDVTALGMGLLHQVNSMTVHDYVASKLVEFPNVDTVVFEFSGVCVCDSVVYGSEDFYRQWYAAAQELVDFVRAKGITVLWTIAPPVPQQRLYHDIIQQISQHDRVFAAQNGLIAVDWWEAFTDVSNQYEQFLIYDDFFGGPQIHEVRFDEGLHFEPDGITRAARWVAAATYEAWRAAG